MQRLNEATASTWSMLVTVLIISLVAYLAKTSQLTTRNWQFGRKMY